MRVTICITLLYSEESIYSLHGMDRFNVHVFDVSAKFSSEKGEGGRGTEKDPTNKQGLLQTRSGHRHDISSNDQEVNATVSQPQ